MNYRHAYHAGSFADVLKHVILIELIKCLQQKDKPFFYLDTHAGRGFYDLDSVESGKTNEAESGIRRLLGLAHPPAELQDYLNTMKACQQKPSDYPGSPLFVRQLMRDHDRMALTELHPEEFALLEALFKRDRQVQTLRMDAYQSLKALLPPTPRRGLVLIDPAFEVVDEFDQIITGLTAAFKRWQEGIYAIWYPIKDRHEVARFIRKLERLGHPLLTISLQIFERDETTSLKETGLSIMNPPYQFEARLQKILPVLWKILSPQGEGRYTIEHFQV